MRLRPVPPMPHAAFKGGRRRQPHESAEIRRQYECEGTTLAWAASVVLADHADRFFKWNIIFHRSQSTYARASFLPLIGSPPPSMATPANMPSL